MSELSSQNVGTTLDLNLLPAIRSQCMTLIEAQVQEQIAQQRAQLEAEFAARQSELFSEGV